MDADVGMQMRGIEPSPTEGSAFVRQTDPDTRLMVVDGQRLFRNAVRMVTMELCPQVEMVAEAENRREAMRLARRLKPQLILLSVQPTEEDTFLAIRSLRRAVPDCRIVVLIEDEDTAFAFNTVLAGCNGYLSRRCSSTELALAIAVAIQDGLVMPRRHLSLALRGLGHSDIIRLDQPAGRPARA